MFDVNIICARKQELQEIGPVVMEAGEPAQKRGSGVSESSAVLLRNNHGEDVRVGITMCGEMGNVSSAARTAYFFNEFGPILQIFCGIAGSLEPKKARLGDVIIPTKVYSYFYNRVMDSSVPIDAPLGADNCVEYMADRRISFRPRTWDRPLDSQAIQIISELNFEQIERQIESEDLPQIFSGHSDIWIDRKATLIREEDLFSWEWLFDSRILKSYLKQHHKLNGSVAVDMESYGFLSTVLQLRERHATTGIIVRGISDYVGYKEICDSEKDARKGEKFRLMGLRNAARVAVEIIKNVNLSQLARRISKQDI